MYLSGNSKIDFPFSCIFLVLPNNISDKIVYEPVRRCVTHFRCLMMATARNKKYLDLSESFFRISRLHEGDKVGPEIFVLVVRLKP